MKSFRKTFAFLLAMVVLLGCAPLSTSAQAASMVSFTMDGFYDYEQARDALNIINQSRTSSGLPALTIDDTLTGHAMTRAAEVYVYSDSVRPNGYAWNTVLTDGFTRQNTVQRFVFSDTARGAAQTWMTAAELYNTDYCTAGIGCYRQADGSTAWVLLLSTESSDSALTQRGSVPVSVEIDALPSNLGGQILHHSFSNAYCACYLFEGLTVGTQLRLLNVKNTSVEITSSEIDYSYVSSNEAVFSIDNDAHTMTAVAPGTATLTILVDGQPILMDSRSVNVEVWETPALSYEKVDDELHIHYGDFPTSVNLYYKGTKDELWIMGNIEADGIYELTHVDPTETYTFVIRYYDKWLNNWVYIGEPLVIKLGNADPEPEVTPTPTPTPDMGGLKLPTESDLPNRTAEPTVAEVSAELDRILTKVYPAGMDWPYSTAYVWHGGISFSPYENDSYNSGKGTAGFAMAVSDLIFGKLPANRSYDMTANDLRPGDIIVTKNYDCYLVLEATPLYIQVATTDDIASGLFPESVKTLIFPSNTIDKSLNYVLTRYTSAPVGADVLHPSIVPANEEVLASKTSATYINYIYESVIKWTLTNDGTLYLEGIGSPAYGDDTWSVYKNQIKKLVFGPDVTGVRQDTFKGYNALEEIVLGDDVTEIRRSTFTDCTNLKSIVFGSGLKAIEENAFQYSGLERLTLPEGLESIGAYAFSGCKNLKSLYIPASVTQWGNNAFTSCDALEELTLEDGLTTLGYSAFNHLDKLKTVTIPGSIKTVPRQAFYFSNVETVILEDGVEVIDEYAFGYCKTLKEIHLPNTLTTVIDNAFRDAENVTDVYFYGTEAEWANVSIGTSNDCLAGYWWSSTTIHFVDGSVCFHKNVSTTPAVNATCEESGLTEGRVCADCGEVLALQETIPALGHDYVEVSRREATCITTGRIDSVCSRNKNHLQSKFLAPTGIHNYENGSCIVCGEEEPTVIENPFTDVSESDWYFAPVMWAKANNVTGGKTATTFAPNEGCTRAQVVTFLWAAAGKPEPTMSVNPFDDVANDAWYLKPVLWAVEKGITGGISQREFGPEQTCTRAQIVTFLYAAAGKPPVNSSSSFSDVANSDWYAAPVIWAAENDVTGGIGNNMFGPNNTCTRAQVVTFLYKVYGK